MSQQPMFSTDSFDYDEIFTNTEGRRDSSGILATGQVLTKGSVLGIATGKLYLVDSGGTATAPYAVLLEDTDSSAGDIDNVPICLAAEFNEDRLIFGGADDADTHRDAMRAIGMFMRKVETR